MISVLYVDDEPTLLELGKIFLEATAGFTVDTFTSAKSTLEILPQKQYDAIISDYQMPGMDGIAFLKAVRATGSNIPFILFTGRGREEVVIDAINNGVDFYLQKGGDTKAQFAELAHKIRHAVRRRSAEENLQKSEEQYRTIVNDLSEMIVRFDPEGTITFSNAAYTGFVHCWRGVDECVGKNFREIIGAEKYEAELGRAITLLTPDQPYHSQGITETWVDNSTHWYQWGIRAFFSPEGVVSEFQAVGHDITDLKENENDLRAANEQLTASEEELRNQFEELADNQAALKKSEEKFRDIVETSLDLIWEMDSDGTFTYMSPSCTGTLGYSPAELVGRTVFAIVPEKELPAFRELFSRGIRTMKQKNEFDLPLQCKDGRVRVLETRSIPLLDNTGRFTGFRGTARDMTDQRKALKALAESEEKYRLLTEVTSDIIYTIDTEGTITHVSPQITRYGYTLQQVVSRHVSEFIYEKDWERAKENLEKSLSTGESTVTPLRIRDPAGNLFWMEDNRAPVRSPSGAVTGISGIMRDVTGRKLAEEQMRESEIKFSTVFQRSPVSLTLVSATEGKFVDANDAFLTSTGYSRDEVIGKRTEDVGIFADTNEYNRFVSVLREQGMVHGMELKCRIKSGEIRACRFSSGILLLGGKPHILSTVEDITERKKTEDALRQSEEKFRALVENSLDGILILDPQGKILFVNHAAGKIIEEENFHDLIGARNVMEFIAPESHADVIRDFSTVASGVDGYLAQYKLTTVNQKERWVESLGKTIIFEGAAAILISLRDITDRVVTQSALQTIVGSMVGTTGLNSLRKIAENVSSWLGADCVMVGEIQPDNQTVRVLSMQLDGKAVEDFIYTLKGTPCENVAEKGFCHYPDDAIRLFPKSKDLVTLNIRGYIGTPLKNSDGKVIGILCVLFRNPFQSSPTVQQIMEIIAVKAGAEIERSQIERALQESEGKFRSFVENANDIVFSMNREGAFTYVSPKCTELLGYETRELIGKPAADLIHPDDFPCNRECFLQTLTTGKKTNGLEYRLRHKNGTWQWHIQNGSPIVDSAGNIVAYLGISHDITDRKRAEAELQKSQYFLTEAMDMAQMADWEFDVPTGIFTFNDQFYALYGTTAGREGGYQMPAEVYAREFVHPEDQHMVGEEMAKALCMPESGYIALREHRIIRRDGEVRHIVVHIRVTQIAEGRIIKTHGANQDITDRKKMEEAIRQANRKLNLLSGITRHDILNQLTALNGFTVLLKAKIPDPAPEDYISRISRASNQIASLIEFTKEYEEIGVHAPAWQNLRALADNGARDALTGPITSCNDLPRGCEIFADPLIAKVFFNLVDNAVRHGEKITTLRFSSREERGALVVVCEDDGTGVAVGDKERIFEQGFGKNTGFGLALSREILDITGITITENGEPGKGARFEITVPAGAWRYAGKNG